MVIVGVQALSALLDFLLNRVLIFGDYLHSRCETVVQVFDLMRPFDNVTSSATR
jgi:hypothetical protein